MFGCDVNQLYALHRGILEIVLLWKIWLYYSGKQNKMHDAHALQLVVLLFYHCKSLRSEKSDNKGMEKLHKYLEVLMLLLLDYDEVSLPTKTAVFIEVCSICTL